MTRRRLFPYSCVGALGLVAALAASPSAAPQAQSHPSFDGLWNSGTATPLERPAALRDKPRGGR